MGDTFRNIVDQTQAILGSGDNERFLKSSSSSINKGRNWPLYIIMAGVLSPMQLYIFCLLGGAIMP